MMADMTKLTTIQTKISVPKNQMNPFTKAKYRNAEDILCGVKSLLEATKTAISLSDEFKILGDIPYIEATASLYDAESGELISSTKATAGIDMGKKLDRSQMFGSASSYARKYALCGLLAIDDSKLDAVPDIDSQQPPRHTQTARPAQKAPPKEDLREKVRESIRSKGVNEEDFAKFGYAKPFAKLTKEEVEAIANNFDVFMKKYMDSPEYKAKQEEVPF